MDTKQKSWKDRMPPDGHLPASYEVQVCDEGNKTVAVQMLDKAGLKYKISARKGQFYIQACDMQTFTQVKRVLDQSLDMSKEANHLGFPPEVTPVGTNTPQADITAATVAVEPKPVKEEQVEEGKPKTLFQGLTEISFNNKFATIFHKGNMGNRESDVEKNVDKMLKGKFFKKLKAKGEFKKDKYNVHDDASYSYILNIPLKDYKEIVGLAAPLQEATTYKWNAIQKKTLEKLWDKLERAEEYEGALVNRKVVEEAFQEGYEFGRKDAGVQ